MGLITMDFDIIEIEPQRYHSIIRAMCKNAPLHLILDTGASQSVLNKEYEHYRFKKSSLESMKTVYSLNAKIKEYGEAIIPKIKIGRRIIHNTEFTLINFDYINRIYQDYAGFQIDGLLGNDFFLKHAAVINYDKKQIRLKLNNST